MRLTLVRVLCLLSCVGALTVVLSSSALAWADPVTREEFVRNSPIESSEAPVSQDSLATTPAKPALTYVNPELAGNPYKLSEGKREFLNRIVFSPGFGRLGSEKLYAFRLGYNPNPWLGYEVSIGHNPGQAVHALFHTINAVVRVPFSGRLQPYVTGGYGMMLVYPGRLFKADPVTKNTLLGGGGVEFYIRDDVALRTEWRHVTVIGGERNSEETVTYNYGEATVGFAFYRTLGR